MCDASDTRHATLDHEDPPYDVVRPTTPLPDSSRTLRRTMSYRSLDTIRPSDNDNRGIRRRITEIAENLKQKSAKKTKKNSSARDVSKRAADDKAFDSKSESKPSKHGRKATTPLRDSSRRSEEESVLAIADRLHSGVPSELDEPSLHMRCDVDKSLAKKDKGDHAFPILGAIAAKLLAAPTPRASIKDIQLDVRPSERDLTIWDGLQASHHVFKCKLYLRCTTHPYNGLSVPDTPRIEMDCNTRPVGSRYAKPPVLQTSYEGTSPGLRATSNGSPNVTLEAGIHVDRFWRTIKHNDGTWGWYRDALVPLSPRLFDKIEYREFELVGRVWVGDDCLERALTFSITMLLREVEMR